MLLSVKKKIDLYILLKNFLAKLIKSFFNFVQSILPFCFQGFKLFIVL